MQQAIGAGDIGQIKGILAKRFPTLRFGETDFEDDEIAKPEETTAAPRPMAVDEEKDLSTKDLYDSYIFSLPVAARNLVTTDYKGTRGGRLGAGGVYTADVVPGSQTEAPKEKKPKTPAPTQAPVYTTYNYYQNYNTYNERDRGDRESYSPSTSTPSDTTAPAPSLNRQIAAKAISRASGGGVSAAARSTGNTGSINRAEAAALKSSGLSAKQIERRAENKDIKLTDKARKELGLRDKKKKKNR